MPGGASRGVSPLDGDVIVEQGFWAIWQYSDAGKAASCANAKGHVDLDVLAKGVSVEDLLIDNLP